jgi:hypothetical protein
MIAFSALIAAGIRWWAIAHKDPQVKAETTTQKFVYVMSEYQRDCITIQPQPVKSKGIVETIIGFNRNIEE